MKTAMIMMVVAGLGLGTAQAETVDATPGFDRVGRVALQAPQKPAVRAAAPGESPEESVASYPARKREMARRLVWLMLSAR